MNLYLRGSKLFLNFKMFYDIANLFTDPAPERPDRIDCVRDALPLVCTLGVIAGVIGGVAAALCAAGEALPLGGRLCALTLVGLLCAR